MPGKKERQTHSSFIVTIATSSTARFSPVRVLRVLTELRGPR